LSLSVGFSKLFEYNWVMIVLTLSSAAISSYFCMPIGDVLYASKSRSSLDMLLACKPSGLRGLVQQLLNRKQALVISPTFASNYASEIVTVLFTILVTAVSLFGIQLGEKFNASKGEAFSNAYSRFL
jgi:hypothetical protein